MRKLGVFATLVLVAALALPVSAHKPRIAAHSSGRSICRPHPPPKACSPASIPAARLSSTGTSILTDGKRFLTLVEEFNTDNPWSITVEASNQGSYDDIYQKMMAGIPTGDVPNLVVAYQNNAAAYYQAGGLVEELDVYVKDVQWGFNEAEVADFVPGFFTQDYTPDGAHRIGFPPNRSSEALFYNLSALKELGYDAPPATWDEFREMACAFTEQGWSGYTAAIRPATTVRTDASFVAAATFALGGDIFKDGAFIYNSPETAQALQFMVSLYQDGCAQVIVKGGGSQDNFTTGKALFYVGSTSGLPFVRADIEKAFSQPFEWSVTFIPYGDVPVQNVYGASVSILKSTPEAQLAAWLFVRWFTEPEQQARWAEISSYYPVRFSAQANMQVIFADFPQFADAWKLIQGETKVEPQLASYDLIRKETQATFNTLLSGGGDVETALTDLTNRANEIVASFTPEASQ